VSEAISIAKKQTSHFYFIFLMLHAATFGLFSRMTIPELMRFPSGVAFYPVGVDYIAHF